MSEKPLSRREFVRAATVAATAPAVAASLRDPTDPTGLTGSSPDRPTATSMLRWLDGVPPTMHEGTTWGVPWPQGVHPRGTAFALRTTPGTAVPVQSWPLAYWPDGSLKWTAHALAPDTPRAEGYELAAGASAALIAPLRTAESHDTILIDTGAVQIHVAKRGRMLIPSIERDGRQIVRDGRLMLLLETTPAATPTPALFRGEIASATLEQSGPVRAVVKIEGRHVAVDGARTWLPFVVRLYCYAASDAVRVIHTIVYDGDEQRDFIRGLGLAVTVPMRGAPYDRHIRFSGQDDGLCAEAVLGVTGLRRDPGRAVREAQLAGAAAPPIESWNPEVAERLQYIPTYGDWTLSQPNADGYEIRKRTKGGFTWLSAARGQRAGGLAYVGTPAGGAALGIRDFWQSNPTQLDVRGAVGDDAELTAWLWAPDAMPMDLRGYHDVMGMDTYAKQYNGGLAITYEDYEPGFDRPEGVARTSELMLWALAATPSRSRMVEMADVTRTPPRIVVSPEYLHRCHVFGDLWSPVDRSTPAKAAIEDKLEWMFGYYRQQQEERRWYGFWNYGDVVHTYDPDRHEWRYDVGGYGWDNSELSTDIWLWLHFVRTGRAEAFRFAEAMTRHTGEVDVHHVGRFAPLGSRHNVLHWGDSAKQLRISTAVNRRYYYYLTADERVGDLMREQIEAGYALLRIPPGRKLSSAAQQGDLTRPESTGPAQVGMSFGTDWGSLAGAWLTEWERTGDPRMLARLRESMHTIGTQPHGFFSAGALMNLETGAFTSAAAERVGASHLNAVFGLVEVCAELIQLIDEPDFRRAWLDYCEIYNAAPAEQRRRFGRSFDNATLHQGHARLTAYAAKSRDDAALARRAWSEFYGGRGVYGPRPAPEPRPVTGPAVLRPVHEVAEVSTNTTAQWGLAAIECLALIGDSLGTG